MSLPAGRNDELREYEQSRRDLLAEHVLLRTLLGRVFKAADQIKRADPMGGALLRISLPPLCTALEAHFAHEEEVLTPLLSRLDGWGAVRHERMRQEHDWQRRGLIALTEMVDKGCEDYLLAEQAIEFGQAQLVEIDTEEIDLYDLPPIYG